MCFLREKHTFFLPCRMIFRTYVACKVICKKILMAENIESSTKSTAACVIVLGMAGSGKTTFVQRLQTHLRTKHRPPYLVNLDPAVSEVPYPVNVDIRDTVKYKDVMKDYGLGPNGAIMTSLNLFTTRFDQVLKLLEKRREEVDMVLIDTPGQIEVFTWSASGAIITESLAAEMPTIVVYVMDTQRSTSPITFMSNMLYACSILYKSKLPFIVVMNKTDIVNHNFAESWMRDWTVFQESLQEESGYMTNLTQSMSLVLEEFYRDLKCCGVSSLMGTGFDELLTLIAEAKKEYYTDYKAEYERRKEAIEEQRRKNSTDRFKMDHMKSSLKTDVIEKPD